MWAQLGRSAPFSVVAGIAGIAGIACSNIETVGRPKGADASTTPAPVDAGAPPADGSTDAALAARCAPDAFVDRTAPEASRTLVWELPLPLGCVRIRAGQTVTWMGQFSTHPLLPVGGGEAHPIKPTSSGTEATFTFANPGVFDFVCDAHATMFGAIMVVE